jgi:hypothetical protein
VSFSMVRHSESNRVGRTRAMALKMECWKLFPSSHESMSLVAVIVAMKRLVTVRDSSIILKLGERGSSAASTWDLKVVPAANFGRLAWCVVESGDVHEVPK